MVKEFANVGRKHSSLTPLQLKVLSSRFTTIVENHKDNPRGMIVSLDYAFEMCTGRRFYTGANYAKKAIVEVRELYDAAMEYHASLQNVTK